MPWPCTIVVSPSFRPWRMTASRPRDRRQLRQMASPPASRQNRRAVPQAPRCQYRDPASSLPAPAGRGRLRRRGGARRRPTTLRADLAQGPDTARGRGPSLLPRPEHPCRSAYLAPVRGAGDRHQGRTWRRRHRSSQPAAVFRRALRLRSRRLGEPDVPARVQSDAVQPDGPPAHGLVQRAGRWPQSASVRGRSCDQL